MMDKIKILNRAISAVMAAGKEVLDVYHTHFDVEQKDDHSPLTLADKLAHQAIIRCLNPLGIPIISEEGGDVPYEERKNWQQFWLVDPLDGTKEFIKKNDEFTVNIALIENKYPYLGVVYVPVPDRLYFGCNRMGSFRMDQANRILEQQEKKTLKKNIRIDHLLNNAKRLPIYGPSRTVFTIVGSRSHPSPALGEFIEKLKDEHNGQIEFITAGSSLKICLVAEGSADIYPRLGATREWDTAAGQAVAEYAGTHIYVYDTKESLSYNKENLLNPWFVVKRTT